MFSQFKKSVPAFTSEDGTLLSMSMMNDVAEHLYHSVKEGDACYLPISVFAPDLCCEFFIY